MSFLEAPRKCSLGARSSSRERANCMFMKFPKAPVLTRTATCAVRVGKEMLAANRKKARSTLLDEGRAAFTLWVLAAWGDSIEAQGTAGQRKTNCNCQD